MRKLKKESKIIRYNGIMAIIERINNDKNGNPKYQVQLINIESVENIVKNENNISFFNNQYYNITSYNIEEDIKNIIDNNEIDNLN